MKVDEFSLLKAVNIELDEKTGFLLTLQYHTEKGDRSKSRYRWLGRVYLKDDLSKHIDESKSDAHRLEAWKWPDDPSWDGKIYSADSNRGAEARFLRNKLKKMVDWDMGVKVLNGWREIKSNPSKTGYNEASKYEVSNYTISSGQQLASIVNRELLLTLVGQNLWHEVSKTDKKTTASAMHPANDIPEDAAQPQPSQNETVAVAAE